MRSRPLRFTMWESNFYDDPRWNKDFLTRLAADANFVELIGISP
jgi:hypothetical protein